MVLQSDVSACDSFLLCQCHCSAVHDFTSTGLTFTFALQIKFCVCPDKPAQPVVDTKLAEGQAQAEAQLLDLGVTTFRV